VGELDIGVVPADLGHHLAPEHHGLQHVRLVDREHLSLARARDPKCDMGDARHLVFLVAHRIDGFALLTCRFDAAARLAEIDVAVQLRRMRMSSPSTTSAFSVEALRSSGRSFAGR